MDIKIDYKATLTTPNAHAITPMEVVRIGRTFGLRVFGLFYPFTTTVGTGGTVVGTTFKATATLQRNCLKSFRMEFSTDNNGWFFGWRKDQIYDYSSRGACTTVETETLDGKMAAAKPNGELRKLPNTWGPYPNPF